MDNFVQYFLVFSIVSAIWIVLGAIYAIEANIFNYSKFSILGKIICFMIFLPKNLVSLFEKR